MWKYTEYDTEPSLIDENISEKYVYVRRNVKSIKKDDITTYECEEMKISKEVYEIVSSIKSSNDDTEFALIELASLLDTAITEHENALVELAEILMGGE